MNKTNKNNQLKKALLEALSKTLGVVSSACDVVGINRGVFYRLYNSDPEFAEQVKDLENVALDFVESKLYELINEKNPTAIIFYLKTKGKSRGYIERQEIQQNTNMKFDFGDPLE
jgi:hypothetical protein